GLQNLTQHWPRSPAFQRLGPSSSISFHNHNLQRPEVSLPSNAANAESISAHSKHQPFRFIVPSSGHQEKRPNAPILHVLAIRLIKLHTFGFQNEKRGGYLGTASFAIWWPRISLVHLVGSAGFRK